MKATTVRYLGFLAPLIAGSVAAASEFRVKVVGVTDGDMITVLVESRPAKIRLASINAPKRRQPCKQRAKDAQAQKVLSAAATAENSGARLRK